jgi:hypothetical protein
MKPAINGERVESMARWVAILLLGAALHPAQAQQWKDAPAYDKAQAKNVLDRSTLYMPLFGAVYRESSR